LQSLAATCVRRPCNMLQTPIAIPGILGESASRAVFLGFASARLLNAISFADVLDEDSGRGYQRRLSAQHSLDFRRYIQLPGASTIPLTFNARPSSDGAWRVVKTSEACRLEIFFAAKPVLAQVDCQHRLGHLQDLDTPLPFMCFLGLTEREEMETFKVINSKAKGLSASLLDYHAATLATNLAKERPELLVALHLNTDPESPWYRQLDLGGTSTSGLQRRASLRTMQKAIKHFLYQTRMKNCLAETIAGTVLAFWSAVAFVAQHEWANPRHHLLTKGVGVYALMAVAADLVLEAGTVSCDKKYFASRLSEFLQSVDWSTAGDFQGLGGESGVKQAVSFIRDLRRKQLLRAVESG
jgi:DNA sulfur modification protein DndB